MSAVDRLLNLNKPIIVNRDLSGNIYVSYENSKVKDGCMLAGIVGRGSTFEYACEEYLKKISGKTLVFNAISESRQEVTVL